MLRKLETDFFLCGLLNSLVFSHRQTDRHQFLVSSCVYEDRDRSHPYVPSWTVHMNISLDLHSISEGRILLLFLFFR